MRISGLNFQLPYPQSSGSNADGTPSPFEATLASRSKGSPQDETQNGTVTAEDLRTGFFGRSRATLQAALAAGNVVNTLSFLTASDIDLIQKATGVTIRDGLYYNKAGTEVGIHYDSKGNLAEPDATTTQAAADLAHALSEMRDTGGPEGNVDLQEGKNISVKDLEAYLRDYAAAGPNTYKPDVNIIKKAETIIESEGNS